MIEEKIRILIQERLRERMPFVCYRKPDSNRIVTWLCDAAEYLPAGNLSVSGFIFSPFVQSGKTVLFPRESSEILEIEFKQLSIEMSQREKGGFKGDGLSHQRTGHIELVKKAVHEIQEGKALKIVVSRKEEVQNIALDAASIFLRLTSVYPNAFSYIWYHPEIGLWTGASPETLVQVNGTSFRTMALAVTQRDKGSQEVIWGEKEKEEQGLVTDLIRKELGPMLDKVGKPYTQRAGHLLHLRTDIDGKMTGNQDLAELIQRLHPTAAICGLPRKEALRFIQNKEGYSRDYYTGFMGELNAPEQGVSNLFVNLRCMQLFPDQQKAWIYVGGGITASSDPEREWQETQAKSETMKKVFS